MGVFQRVARPAILAASHSPRLRHTAERLPITRKVVDRFVAGETVPEALDTVGALRDSGRFVTVPALTAGAASAAPWAIARILRFMLHLLSKSVLSDGTSALPRRPDPPRRVFT